MSNKPNLFMLGAPKCGTTTIYHWLTQVQDIFTSNVKEPHHFCKDYQLTDSSDYNRLYERSASYKYALDASVWYFYYKSWREIYKHNPKSKLILLLRNPLSMMQSMHSQQVYNGNELETKFNKAIELNDLRSKGETVKVKKGYPSHHLDYLGSCCLDKNLEEFMNEIPIDNRLILTLDELKNEKQTWDKICEFLKIDFSQITFKTSNRRRVRRSLLLDRLVLTLVSLKKLIGFDKRLGLLSKLRRYNTKTINSRYDKFDIDDKVILRINRCVENYENLLKIKLENWYV